MRTIKYIKIILLVAAVLPSQMFCGAGFCNGSPFLMANAGDVGSKSPALSGLVNCATHALGDVDGLVPPAPETLVPAQVLARGYAQWLPLDARANRLLLDLDVQARERLANEETEPPSNARDRVLFLIGVNGQQKTLNKKANSERVDEMNRIYFSMVLEQIRRDPRLRKAMITVPGTQGVPASTAVLSVFSWMGIAFQGLTPEELHLILREVHQKVSRDFRDVARRRNWTFFEPGNPLLQYPDLWHYWGLGYSLDDATQAGRMRRHALNQDLMLQPTHSSSPTDGNRPLSENRRVIGLATHKRHGIEMLHTVSDARNGYQALLANADLRHLLFTSSGQLKGWVVDAYREALGETQDLRARRFLDLIHSRIRSNSDHSLSAFDVSYDNTRSLLGILDSLNMISVNPLQAERRSVQHVREIPGLRWIVSGDLVGAGRINIQTLIREFLLGPPMNRAVDISLRARKAFEDADRPMLRRTNQMISALRNVLQNGGRRIVVKWSGGVEGRFPVRIFEEVSPNRTGKLLAVMDASGDDVLMGVTRELDATDVFRFSEGLSREVRNGFSPENSQDLPGDFRITVHPSQQGFGPQTTAGLESFEKYLRQRLRESEAIPPEVLENIGLTPRILGSVGMSEGSGPHVVDVHVTFPRSGLAFSAPLKRKMMDLMNRILNENIVNNSLRRYLPGSEFGEFVTRTSPEVPAAR